LSPRVFTDKEKPQALHRVLGAEFFHLLLASGHTCQCSLGIQAYHDVKVGLRALTRAVGQPAELQAKPVAAPPAVLQPR
jgi:hypothetical protein